MKFILNVIISLTLIAFFGCSKDSDTNFIPPGYTDPGVFEEKTVAPEKEFTFSDASISESCAPSTQCIAIYANWISPWTDGAIPYEGIALNDKHDDNNFSLKIHRISGYIWTISILKDGKVFNTVIEITSTEGVNIADAMKFTTPDNLEHLCKIEFTNDIAISPSDTIIDTDDDITIKSGDYIVAQRY